MIDNLYHLHIDASVNVSKKIVNAIRSKRSRDEINLKYMWHLKLGHIREDRINRLKKDDLLGSLNNISYLIYEFCLQEKNNQITFYKTRGEDH